jgi:ABC-type nitrate/sulfonate/bicarbonate transport system permease component
VARAYGATTWQLYVKVSLPAVVLSVLAGIRLALDRVNDRPSHWRG